MSLDTLLQIVFLGAFAWWALVKNPAWTLQLAGVAAAVSAVLLAAAAL